MRRKVAIASGENSHRSLVWNARGYRRQLKERGIVHSERRRQRREKPRWKQCPQADGWPRVGGGEVDPEEEVGQLILQERRERSEIGSRVGKFVGGSTEMDVVQSRWF